MTARATTRPHESPGSKALRAAGYGKPPQWWFTKEQLELIEYMGRQNKPEVDRIKGNAEHDRD